MNWFVELHFANGTVERAYCTTREEARARRKFYLTMTDPKSPWRVVFAHVRKMEV